MRISDQDKHSIINAVYNCISPKAMIWLFGSRCDDSAKGGDIDLFIESPPLENRYERKLKLKLALEDSLGEQKIDLLIRYQDQSLSPIQTHAKKPA